MLAADAAVGVLDAGSLNCRRFRLDGVAGLVRRPGRARWIAGQARTGQPRVSPGAKKAMIGAKILLVNSCS